MQRLHVDDLVGHVLEKGEAWTHLNLPAIADAPDEVALGEGTVYRRPAGQVLHPEREPLTVLDELKAAMGSQAFSAQYQQTPVPPGGALIVLSDERMRYYGNTTQAVPIEIFKSACRMAPVGVEFRRFLRRQLAPRAQQLSAVH